MTTAEAILTVGSAGLAVILMVVGYQFRRAAYAIGAAGAWLVAAFWNYSLTTGAWDISFAAFWLCLGLAVVSALEGMVLRPRPDQLTAEEMEDEEHDEYFGKWESFQTRLNAMHRPSSRRREQRERRDDSDDFARTGRIGR